MRIVVTFLLELLQELRKKLGPNGGDQRWEFIRKQESKKTRKQELDQESDQENKKTRTRPRQRPRKKEKTFFS